MAREDVVPQLLRMLMQKEGPPPETDNTILQKMIVILDSAATSDTVTVTAQIVANSTWGDGSIWGGRQWN